MPVPYLHQLQEACRELIGRAQKSDGDDDWEVVGRWDLNVWLDDSGQWRGVIYPIMGDTADYLRGIVIRGDQYEGQNAFPSIQTLRSAAGDPAIAAALREWWIVEVVQGPEILITPNRWGKHAPRMLIE